VAVQDLGVTMWEVGEDEVTWPYRDTLRAGYERIAPWPERRPGQIDAFAANRGLVKSATSYENRRTRRCRSPHVGPAPGQSGQVVPGTLIAGRPRISHG
jgi:hypothetical protein